MNKTPARRYSTATAPKTTPNSRDNLELAVRPTHDIASTWNTYSGELRSPTQRSNDLIGTTKISNPMSENKNHKNNLPYHHGNSDISNNFPMPPELTRNQSRSADSKPNYLLNDPYLGTTKGLERDQERERERSVSVDKDRINSRPGRPPQHVSRDILIYNSTDLFFLISYYYFYTFFVLKLISLILLHILLMGHLHFQIMPQHHFLLVVDRIPQVKEESF